MKNEVFALLRRKGIEFAEGLNDFEYIRIKQEYDIEFPNEMKEYYSIALPISKNFYNWRDFSVENISRIKRMMQRPFNGIYEMADEVYWCDDWGAEPDKLGRINIIRQKLEEAPKLVPIYLHRYMPMINKRILPVFSICDTDVICYGENFTSYLEIEFGDKQQSEIDFTKIEYVPFWSDLIL